MDANLIPPPYSHVAQPAQPPRPSLREIAAASATRNFARLWTSLEEMALRTRTHRRAVAPALALVLACADAGEPVPARADAPIQRPAARAPETSIERPERAPPSVRTGAEYLAREGQVVHLQALLVSIEDGAVGPSLRARLEDGVALEFAVARKRIELYRPRLGTRVILVARWLDLGRGRSVHTLLGACDGTDNGCGSTRRGFDAPRVDSR